MILTVGLTRVLENGNVNMPIKKIKKAQPGERVFPMSTKKGYKAKVIENTSPEGVTTAKVKVRRTVGGLFSGKPRGKNTQMPVYNVPQRTLRIDAPERPKGMKYDRGDSADYIKAKKGTKMKKSIVKSKSIKKKK